MKSIDSNLIPIAVWAAKLGISTVTAWRYARYGWIHPVKVVGKTFISIEDARNFERGAAAGEFTKPPTLAKDKSPKKRRGSAKA